MTIDKNQLDQAKEWAGDVDTQHPRPDGTYWEGYITAVEVVRALPDVIVDGDKLREVLDWRDSKPSGDDYDSEFWDRLQALLPDPTPQAEIALGNWAMHPEHGKVLILSEHIDRDGDVCITWEGLESFHSEIGRWVPATDLSPLPEALEAEKK